jgi:3-methyladenine DNA glycosylase AlkD
MTGKSGVQDQLLTCREISNRLRSLSDSTIAKHSQRFFKTARGEYGEGDEFLGIRVPTIRALVRNYGAIKLGEIRCLLESPYHEERLCALLLLVREFDTGDATRQSAIYQLYLANTQHINNWDLVDSSASQIVGRFLECRDRSVLYDLAGSGSIWKRRISIIATFHFIRIGQFDDSLKLVQLLLNDREDLIHKAAGWMLREVGNRDVGVETAFLAAHYRDMPRTMLRYAIERFPERTRKLYLSGEI